MMYRLKILIIRDIVAMGIITREYTNRYGAEYFIYIQGKYS